MEVTTRYTKVKLNSADMISHITALESPSLVVTSPELLGPVKSHLKMVTKRLDWPTPEVVTYRSFVRAYNSNYEGLTQYLKAGDHVCFYGTDLFNGVAWRVQSLQRQTRHGILRTLVEDCTVSKISIIDKSEFNIRNMNEWLRNTVAKYGVGDLRMIYENTKYGNRGRYVFQALAV